MDVKPLSPEEVRRPIPNRVIQIFNDLLNKYTMNGVADIPQSAVFIALRQSNIDTEQALSNGWLDIEALYGTAGWEVEYDKPEYNETYAPRFIFREKK